MNKKYNFSKRAGIIKLNKAIVKIATNKADEELSSQMKKVAVEKHLKLPEIKVVEKVNKIKEVLVSLKIKKSKNNKSRESINH